MIEKVTIRNFKSLRDVKVGLERFTVLVGPNGSGKTSVLQGLDFLCRAFREPQAHDIRVAQAQSRGATTPIELAAESGGRWFRYSATGSQFAHEMSSEADPTEWVGSRFGGGKVSPLPLSVMLRLEVSKLVVPSVSTPDPTIIGPDGTGLHTALASMVINDPDSWNSLKANLRLIIPTIQNLRHEKLASGRPFTLLFDTTGADSLPASQVSEGTLLVLGLLTALHGPDRPSLILLDDLDRGLHPLAQRDLVALLRRFMETKPDLQIVATTHSPYLLDCMEPNEVRMTYLEDGSTMCASLEEHPKFEKWKREMAPGELWSLFGEEWLAQKKEAVA